jgi:DNA-binding HxlR family transcriptional regulator
MTSEDEIPERLQRILERIAHSINETERLNAAVAVKPDSRSIQIFIAIECGLHRFEEIQNRLSIPRNILTDRLNTMVKLGIIVKQEYSTAPRRFEYLINDANGGTAGQPAMVPV